MQECFHDVDKLPCYLQLLPATDAHQGLTKERWYASWLCVSQPDDQARQARLPCSPQAAGPSAQPATLGRELHSLQAHLAESTRG